MVQAFTKATGIPASLVDDSTGPLLTKVAVEKNNPQWGLLRVDGDTALAALDRQGELLDYTPSVSLTAAGQSLAPADHSYVPVGMTMVPALLYNAARVTTLPTSYADLLGPQYRGQVGIGDPSQSGPFFPMIADIMNQAGGATNGENYLRELKSNGLHVYPGSTDITHALEIGQINFGLIKSAGAINEVLSAPRNANYDPKIAYLDKLTLMPSGIGIDKRAPAAVQAEAKKFVEFVLSPAGQQVMLNAAPTSDSLFWPVVPGTSPRPGVGALPTQYQRIDPYFWGPLQGQVDTFFHDQIAQ